MNYLITGCAVLVIGAMLILAEREGFRCAGRGVLCIGVIVVLLWKLGQVFGF
jgi:hypothetical protein